MLLGVDTGGTFTDFVLVADGRVRINKVLSTPGEPEQAILGGISGLGISCEGLWIIHGSTVATNAILEGKGARTVLITNRGFRDLLTIGRQARPSLYDLQPPSITPPVPRALCLEVGGRLGADGSVVDPLTDEDLAAMRAALEALDPQSVAVNLLFSFLDARFERAVEAMVPPGVFVSCSSHILPEYGEYERGVATWLNARVGPVVEGYLARLEAGTSPARLSVMQSSGETMEVSQAGRQAVRMLLSGPAGGLAGAGYMGRLAGETRLLSFDMGGTSTDVALIDGEPRLTTEGRIGPYPVGVPMVDMHTIGAGGGSMAWVDAGGVLQVGPESAGADPGPACYGRGGRSATVTDANLVLGRLRPNAFLGGTMPLLTEASLDVLRELGRKLELSPREAAMGIERIVNEHMAHALRVISVQRGIDPREMVLASFGGAGGLHVCALAEALSMGRALVPIHAGVLSALGMLAAPAGRQLSRTLTGLVTEMTTASVESALEGLADAGRADLLREGADAGQVEAYPSMDLRYRGQSYTLNLPWSGALSSMERVFHDAHEHRYGHALDIPVELVNIRVALRCPAPELPLPRRSFKGRSKPLERVGLYGIDEPVEVWERSVLGTERELTGPALVVETVSTTYLAPGWTLRTDPYGNLLLHRRRTSR